AGPQWTRRATPRPQHFPLPHLLPQPQIPLGRAILLPLLILPLLLLLPPLPLLRLPPLPQPPLLQKMNPAQVAPNPSQGGATVITTAVALQAPRPSSESRIQTAGQTTFTTPRAPASPLPRYSAKTPSERATATTTVPARR